HTSWPRDWSSDVCSSDLEKTPVGSEPQCVNHIFARSPELFWRAIRADAVNAAGNQRGEWKERRLDLPLNLCGTGNAGADGGRPLRRGDDRGGCGRAATRFLANRGSVDASVGSHRERSDLALGSFVKHEAFHSRCAGLGIFAAALSCWA